MTINKIKPAELSDEELESLSGGAVVEYKGRYYICMVDKLAHSVQALAVLDDDEEAHQLNIKLTGDQYWMEGEDLSAVAGTSIERMLGDFKGYVSTKTRGSKLLKQKRSGIFEMPPL